ncbi:ead/Ea22-like family protein [Enterobacter kobei]|uniref:ead/Ea22-like family protein n=1 Tax=Enterobacter kobei TaxID=208224 RepID=UPI002FF70FBF
MSNIDKRALREAAEKATLGRIGDRIDGSGSIKYQCFGNDGSLVLQADHKNMEYGFIGVNSEADELFFRLCDPAAVLALLNEIAELEQRHCGTALLEREEMHTKTLGRMLDELDAKDRRNSELTEALKQTVSGYKSCLRMGHDRILDLGGDCDSPEVMIAGNPDIQQAEKLIAAAAGKGE